MATRIKKPAPIKSEGIGSCYEDYMAGAWYFLDYALHKLEQRVGKTMPGEEDRTKLLEKKKWLIGVMEKVEVDSK